MTTRQRGLAMFAIALAGVFVAGGLAIAMRRTRAAQHEGYARDRERLRKDAGATRAPVRDPDPVPSTTRRHCVNGVDTFVVAISRALVEIPRTDRVARLGAIARASDFAVRAEKLAELERPAPTLPQRMGSVADSSAPGGRRPIEPPREACGGKGFAELIDYRPRAKEEPEKSQVEPANAPAAKTKPDVKKKKTKKKPRKDKKVP